MGHCKRGVGDRGTLTVCVKQVEQCGRDYASHTERLFRTRFFGGQFLGGHFAVNEARGQGHDHSGLV